MMRVATPHASPDTRWIVRASLAVTAVLVACGPLKLAVAAFRAVQVRYDLDYGEGIVWQQAVDIFAGHGYAPLGVLPAIVFHYPPVYHLIVATLAWLSGLDMVLVGRLVSAGSALVAVGFAARLAYALLDERHNRWIGIAAASLAGTLWLNSPTALVWSNLMRVDLLSCALTVAGLWWTVQAMRGRCGIWLPAIVFATAVFTKQTAIFAPAAVFVTLMLLRPRTALIFAVWCAGTALIALALLSWQSGGGFLRHIMTYNVNRVELGRLALLQRVLVAELPMLALAAVGAVRLWRQLRVTDIVGLRRRAEANSIFVAQLLLLANFLVRVLTIPLILKSGSSDNYLLDLLIAAAMLTAPAFYCVIMSAKGAAEAPQPLVHALVLVGLPLQMVPVRIPYADALDPRSNAAYDRLTARLAQIDKPIVSDDMVLLRRAGKPVVLEPAIVTELSHTGLYDEAAYVRLIDRRAFGGFATVGAAGGAFEERYSPAVRRAMAAAYPRIERYAGLTLHLPINAGPAASPRR